MAITIDQAVDGARARYARDPAEDLDQRPDGPATGRAIVEGESEGGGR